MPGSVARLSGSAIAPPCSPSPNPPANLPPLGVSASASNPSPHWCVFLPTPRFPSSAAEIGGRLDWQRFSRFCRVGDSAAIPKPRRQRHGLWTRSHATLGPHAAAPFPGGRKGKCWGNETATVSETSSEYTEKFTKIVGEFWRIVLDSIGFYAILWVLIRTFQVAERRLNLGRGATA